MTCQELIVRYMHYIGLDTDQEYPGFLQLQDPERGWMTGVNTDDTDIITFCATESIHFSTEDFEEALALVNPKKSEAPGLGVGLYEYKGKGPYFVFFQRTPPANTDESRIEQSLRFLSRLMTRIVDKTDRT